MEDLPDVTLSINIRAWDTSLWNVFVGEVIEALRDCK